MLLSIDSFLNESECLELLCIAYSATEEEWSDKSNPQGGIWEKNRLPIKFELPLLKLVNKRVASYFCDYSHILNIDSILRFAEGGFMAEHKDDETGVTDFGCVIYLNENFDGGELVYPNLNKSLKPIAGSLVIHDSNEPHMVNTTTKGTRYMLTTFVFGTRDKRTLLNHDS